MHTLSSIKPHHPESEAFVERMQVEAVDLEREMETTRRWLSMCWEELSKKKVIELCAEWEQLEYDLLEGFKRLETIAEAEAVEMAKAREGGVERFVHSIPQEEIDQTPKDVVFP
jgi:hypothetical protein